MIVTRTDPNAPQAPRHHVLHRRHEGARHRDPSDQADQRRIRLQRGVLHRRAGARHVSGGRCQRRLARRDHDADERACVDRRRDGGGPDFTDLLRLAKETQWDGRSAFEDPSVRQRLARFYIRLKGLQYTGYRTLTALSRGAIPDPRDRSASSSVRPCARRWPALPSTCKAPPAR